MPAKTNVSTEPSKQRRGRKPTGSPDALTKQRIVAAGLTLLDVQGAHGFSVRDLARALDVYPASIYWHMGSRNGLLAAMVAAVLADVAPIETHTRWQDWLRDLFGRYRAAIRCHPQAAALIGAQLVSNASIDFDLIEAILRTLSDAGFRDARLREAFSVVMAAQVGFVTTEFAPAPEEHAEQWSADMQGLIHSVDATRCPILAANLDQMTNQSFALRWENGRTAPMDTAFRLYVDTVIAGLEVLARQ